LPSIRQFDEEPQLMIQVPIVWYLVALLGGLRKVGSRLAIGARPADIARLFVRKHSVSFYETQIFSLLTMPGGGWVIALQPLLLFQQRPLPFPTVVLSLDGFGAGRGR
jgi:hypothetical protein